MESALHPQCGARACLCGHVEHRLLFCKNGAEVWQCTECGTGHVDPSSFNADGFYTAEYFNGARPDGYADYEGSASILRAEFRRSLAWLRRVGPPGGRLLEIGCAYGYFLDQASEFYEVHGCEISTHAVSECHRRGLDFVQRGALTKSMAASIGELDVVVMFDVIEHLPDPAQTLKLATENLRPGGSIVITTGDFGSVFARVSGKHWRLMTPPQHLWFFTVEGISKCATLLGLQVVSVEHPWKLVPLSLIAHQVMRMTGLSTHASPYIPGVLAVPVNLFDAMRVTLRK